MVSGLVRVPLNSTNSFLNDSDSDVRLEFELNDIILLDGNIGSPAYGAINVQADDITLPQRSAEWIKQRKDGKILTIEGLSEGAEKTVPEEYRNYFHDNDLREIDAE